MSEEKNDDIKNQGKENAPQDEVKTTARGFLVITAAKVWFLITSAVIQLGLPIFLKSAESFGIFKIVTEAMSLLNMVMITGTLQAVSKLISEEPQRAAQSLNLALKLQCLLGLPLAVAYGLGAPWLVSFFFHDVSLVPYVRISSLIVLFYAFYSIFVGTINGLKEFVKQATLDISFATMKTFFMLLFVVMGFGVAGAIWGFVVAAGIITIASGIWVFRITRRISEKDDSQDKIANDKQRLKRLLKYLILFMIYTIALNAVMRVDLFILKSITSTVAPDLTLPEISVIFSAISNKFSGYYGAALNLARIPYQGIIAITFVIFPMISAATFQDDIDTTRRYITTTLRYCALLVVPVGLVIATSSDLILRVLYSPDYQSASGGLELLSLSIIAFAILYVSMTILMSSGRAVAAVVVMLTTLLLSAILNYAALNELIKKTYYRINELVLGVPRDATLDQINEVMTQPIVVNGTELNDQASKVYAMYLSQAPDYINSAAGATSIAMFIGAIIGLTYIYHKYKAGIPFKTVVRIAIAASVIFALAHFVPVPDAWLEGSGRIAILLITVGRMTLLGLLFFVTLLGLREFNRDDLDRIKRVIKK